MARHLDEGHSQRGDIEQTASSVLARTDLVDGRNHQTPAINVRCSVLGYLTITLPVKKNGAALPKQNTVALPFAKPLSFPSPAPNPPVLKLKAESNPKQVGTAVAVPAPNTIAGAITADATVVGTAIFFIVPTWSRTLPTLGERVTTPKFPSGRSQSHDILEFPCRHEIKHIFTVSGTAYLRAFS